MIKKELFGKTKAGEEVFLYTIENEKGTKACVINYGAILVKLILQGGKDVVLGYDTVAEYEENGCFFGATIGRSANRVGNASFELNGSKVKLSVNDFGKNNLHTDFDKGFHKVIWQAEELPDGESVRFSYHSPDGENGFPGNLDCSVTYHLTHSDALELTYEGISDADTLFNPTNHTYFNLGGHDSGPVLDTDLCIHAEYFTPVDAESIPTGELWPVEGTPMDFRSPRRIGLSIDEDYEQLVFTSGYDHNFCLKESGGLPRKIAQCTDLSSGIAMEVFTDLPGVQFYAGNFVTEQRGKGGAVYGRRHGFCLETQYYPDSANKPSFEKPFIKAGEKKTTVTAYHFVML